MGLTKYFNFDLDSTQMSSYEKDRLDSLLQTLFASGSGSYPSTPGAALTKVVSTTGGNINSGVDLYYAYTWLDANGVETGISPQVAVSTADEIAPPAITLVGIDSTSEGYIEGGQTVIYAVTAVDLAGRETNVLQEKTFFVDSYTTLNSLKITINGLDAQGSPIPAPPTITGWTVYRMIQNENVWKYLGTFSLTPNAQGKSWTSGANIYTFVDNLQSYSAQSIKEPPRVNRTNSTNKITLQRSAPPAEATYWRLYASYLSGQFLSPSLVATYPIKLTIANSPSGAVRVSISSEVTITTTTAHGYYVGASVVVAGCTASFNGTHVVTTVPTTTTFTFTQAGVDETGGGGTTAVDKAELKSIDFNAGQPPTTMQLTPSQFLHLNRTGQTLQQNLAVANGVTIDGIDLSVAMGGHDSHIASTTSVHGITDTAQLATLNTVQTFSANKRFDGNIGIGEAPTTAAKLFIEIAPTATSGTSRAFYSTVVASPSGVSTGYYEAANFRMLTNASANFASVILWGANGTINYSGTSALQGVRAMEFAVSIDSAQTVTSAYGIIGSVRGNAAYSLYTAFGLNCNLFAESGGSITTGYGARVGLIQSGLGTFTTGYGFYCNAPTGTIGTHYGMYLNDRAYIVDNSANPALQVRQDGTGNIADFQDGATSVFKIDDGSKIGFFNVTTVTKQTALTTQLATITHTEPVTPDYAIQNFTQTSPFGFVTADEANSVLKIIANLQTRVQELETKIKAYGLLT